MAVKYVTIPGDKTVHLYAESEFTKCGIPVPINAGAEWTETYDGKVCAACTSVDKKGKDAAEEAVVYSTSELGDISRESNPEHHDNDAPTGGKVASKKDGGKVA